VEVPVERIVEVPVDRIVEGPAKKKKKKYKEILY